MNTEQEPIIERLRQADARSIASIQATDPATMATRVNECRLARKRRRAMAGAAATMVGFVLLAIVAGMLARQTDTEDRIADIVRPGSQSYPPVDASNEYLTRAVALQNTIDELVELERENDRLQQLLAERRELDSQIQQITQMSNRMREYQLDVIRAELSQSVFDNSSNPIVFGY